MAQSVEQLIRNQQVAGPNPATSSKKSTRWRVLFCIQTEAMRGLAYRQRQSLCISSGVYACISSRRSRVLLFPLRFDDMQFLRIDDMQLYELMIYTHSRDNEERLNAPSRHLAVSATNLITGKTRYFEKGKCDIFKAAQASASVPFISQPVIIDDIPYLDGGCSEQIPYGYAKLSGQKKIMVVRTREKEFRKKEGFPKASNDRDFMKN